MAIYRQVHTSFWQDDFVLELTPEEKYFYLYLMTNSKTNQAGVYELPKRVMKFETGYNSETVDRLLTKFIEYGKIKYDESTKEIFIVNWSKFNWTTSPKVLTCIKKEVKAVKNNEFFNNLNRVLIGYGYGIDTGAQEEQEQEQEQEQEEEKEESITPISNIYENIFNYWIERSKESGAFTKHGELNKAMKKSMDTAFRQIGKDEKKMKTLIDRFEKVFELTKNDGKYALRKRTIQQFFGQKVKDASWLICEDYDDEGAKWKRYLLIKDKKGVGDDFDINRKYEEGFFDKFGM